MNKIGYRRQPRKPLAVKIPDPGTAIAEQGSTLRPLKMAAISLGSHHLAEFPAIRHRSHAAARIAGTLGWPHALTPCLSLRRRRFGRRCFGWSGLGHRL